MMWFAVLMQQQNKENLILSFIYLLNCAGKEGKTQFKLNNARVAAEKQEGKTKQMRKQ